MTNTDLTIQVAIGVATFKRPKGLHILLKSLEEMQSQRAIKVIVADNDGPNGEGMQVVEGLANNKYRFPLYAIPVAERGISQARNALLDYGFGKLKVDFLAMIDDDERVDQNWIEQLISVQKETKADIVWGYVVPDFEENPPEWTNGHSLFYRPKHPRGITSSIGGSGHALLSRSIFLDSRGDKILFNKDFSSSGGEDTDFFKRLQMSGASLAFAPDAISYEHYPISRITRKWAIQRSFRTGVTDIRISLLYNRKNIIVYLAHELSTLFAAIIIGVFLSIIFFWAPSKQMRGISLCARQIGKIAGLLGFKYHEYKTIHGH